MSTSIAVVALGIMAYPIIKHTVRVGCILGTGMDDDFLF